MQAKLLRVLEEREFQRLGGTRTLQRRRAASSRPPTAICRAAIARQAFREDLYYRLNVFEIRDSAAARAAEDILVLGRARSSTTSGARWAVPPRGISRDAREWLLAYPWPGNVRELRNAIERAILPLDSGLITREHLPAMRGATTIVPATARARGDGMNLESLERGQIERALCSRPRQQVPGRPAARGSPARSSLASGEVRRPLAPRSKADRGRRGEARVAR